ncbi:class I SAM-dependent methyltransferase [Reyranella soli]|uniref:Methyltransferase n=1 Tax=Reyranella soli TaxID=1230389 RepID=A0A512NIK6_9HYPH|nr:class I SAM-dependent methyltransferase [Reyranella soli]GEP58794.1 methyltransferase [Reyranella soli]
MAIDFHSQANRGTYASRHADDGWKAAIQRIVEPSGRRVADIGCGGGIYSRAWHELGARTVTGVDFSQAMVDAAREQAAGLTDISFRQGDATATGLPPASADVVFQRALIHHLKDYSPCVAEARRVLAPGGTLIVQDRTPDDVELPGSPEHLRGYFFECFPRLLAVETDRRPTDTAVRAALDATGFAEVEMSVLWEVRKVHQDWQELKQDLTERTGRSILHDLSDEELAGLILYIETRLPGGPIVEKDRWTMWSAVA